MKQSDNPAAHTLSDIMEGPPRKKWRQEPVACSLCRTKRLKCDRKTPCANCVARDVPCRSQIEVEDEQVMAKSTTIRNDAVSTNSKDASVLERLAYLERVVLGGQTQDATMMIDAPPRKKLDSISRGPQQSTNLRPPLHFHPWSVEASTDDLVVANQSLPSAFNVPIYDGSKELMQIPLPSYNDAQKILEVYSSKISPLQHVVDLEAAAAQMHAIYVAITQLEMPVLSHVALMLSMWAGATTVLPTQKFDHGHLTPAQAAEMTKFWTEKAFDILDILRRRSAIDLEVVQARDLLGFILFDTEAYTPRMAAEFAFAISSLREVGLHRIDAPGQDPNMSPREKELRRRLFWHIATTDWVLACQAGSYEGTYYTMPKQMIVRKPRNINDTDLDNPDPFFCRPSSEPTIMSYYIYRIRMGEVCRYVADTLPFATADPDNISYEDILACDARFRVFLDELPWFFRISTTGPEIEALHKKSPHLAVQRYILNIVCATIRSKLHQPFMIRGLRDNRFRYSRDMCLESIRTTLHVKGMLDNDPLTPDHAKYGGFVFLVFYAVMMLTMDLCASRTVEEKKSAEWLERKTEVFEAVALLDKAKQSSPMLAAYVSKLVDVLMKHKIKGAEAEIQRHSSRLVRDVGAAASVQQLGGDVLHVPSEGLGMAATVGDEADFNEMWQKYIDDAANFDTTDWDQIFGELDSISAPSKGFA